MRDDIKLSNDVFLPRQPGRYPTILLRTPYETLHEPHIDWAVWWAKRGYAVVHPGLPRPVRIGRDVLPVSRRRSGRTRHAGVDQPASRGTTARSAPAAAPMAGLFQWQLARFRSPYLTAMAPQVIMGDYFGDCHRIGGAVQWALTGFATVIFSTSVALMQLGATHIFGNSAYYRHLPLIDMDVADDRARGAVVPRLVRAHRLRRLLEAHSTPRRSCDEIDVPMRPAGRLVRPLHRVDAAHLEHAAARHRSRARTRRSTSSRGRTTCPMAPSWATWTSARPRTVDLKTRGPALVRLLAQGHRHRNHGGAADQTLRHGRERLALRARVAARPHALHALLPAQQRPRQLALWRRHADTRTAGDEPPTATTTTPTIRCRRWVATTRRGHWMKFAAEPISPGPIDQRPLERRDDVLCYTSPPLERTSRSPGRWRWCCTPPRRRVTPTSPPSWWTSIPTVAAIHLAEGILRARHRDEPGERGVSGARRGSRISHRDWRRPATCSAWATGCVSRSRARTSRASTAT